MNKMLLSAALAATMGTAVAVDTTLEDYAYDFVTIGYEITIEGLASHYDGISSGRSFKVEQGNYSMTTVIDGISRSSRKAFVQYFNANCGRSTPCQVNVTGEVSTSSSMKMVLTANRIAFIGAGDDNKVFE